MEVFEGGSSYGLNVIARADHRAAAETWNVPQVSQSILPECGTLALVE